MRSLRKNLRITPDDIQAPRLIDSFRGDRGISGTPRAGNPEISPNPKVMKFATATGSARWLNDA
jgi:hypothetical protein